jgi:hypothetical protein
VNSRTVHSIVISLAPELFGVRGVSRVNAVGPALERPGRLLGDAHFRRVRDRTGTNAWDLRKRMGLSYGKKSNAWALKR